MDEHTPDPVYLDTEHWPRRGAFEYFRAFDKPYFNVCVRLDVAPLKAAVAGRGVGSFFLACNYLAVRLANEHEPFRYRLQGGRVRVHAAVDGGTTVLRSDDSFGFAYLPYTRDAADYASFARAGSQALAAASRPEDGFRPRVGDDALIHLTTLPWVHFSSFSHARNWGREDSVPKIAFGRAEPDGARLWLPMSVEVHHALMDGLHVGRYVQGFEEALRAPERWLA